MFLKHAALVTLVVLHSINAAYFFNRRPLSAEDVYWAQKSFPANPAAVLRTVRTASYIVPTDFVLGISGRPGITTKGTRPRCWGNTAARVGGITFRLPSRSRPPFPSC